MQRNNDNRQGPQTRRLLKWQDLTLSIALLAACGGFLAVRAANAQPAATAQIHLNGEEIRAISLREGDDYRIDLQEEYGVPVSFEVKGGAIRFVDVTCPDHICERTGFVSLDGQTAVCMPNRVTVIVLKEE